MSTAGHVRLLRVAHGDVRREWRRTAGRDFGATGRTPPPEVLDRLAEERLTGGFDVRPANVCPACRLARAASGACGCE